MFGDAPITSPFVPPTILSPTCTGLNIFNWSIGTPSSFSDQSKYISISINGFNNGITVAALTGGEAYAGSFTFSAVGILPDDTSTTFDFKLDIHCANPVITPPVFTAVKSQVLGETADSYYLDAFTWTPSACDITYETRVLATCANPDCDWQCYLDNHEDL